MADLFTANQSVNATSVAISLPAIERGLHTEETQLQWLISGYPLSSMRLYFSTDDVLSCSGVSSQILTQIIFQGCLILLLLGRFADLHGRKKTFIGGSLWLMVFTLGCGFARGTVLCFDLHLRVYFLPLFVDTATLNILGGFQGIGAAATIPACVSFLLLFPDIPRTKSVPQLGILAQSFSPGSRARSVAFACFSAGAPLGYALGLVLGVVLVQKTAYVLTVLLGPRPTF